MFFNCDLLVLSSDWAVGEVGDVVESVIVHGMSATICLHESEQRFITHSIVAINRQCYCRQSVSLSLPEQ